MHSHNVVLKSQNRRQMYPRNTHVVPLCEWSNEISPKSHLGFAQNSTRLVLWESRMQWYEQSSSCVLFVHTSAHLSVALCIKSLTLGQCNTFLSVCWYIPFTVYKIRKITLFKWLCDEYTSNTDIKFY